MIFAVTLPIKLVSEANAHQDWRKRAKRAKAQGHVTTLACRAGLRFAMADAPLIVTITRIAPRALDSDNLQGAGKHVRDAVAICLGIDDRDPRVEWRVRQEKGAPKSYATRIEVAKLASVVCPHCRGSGVAA